MKSCRRTLGISWRRIARRRIAVTIRRPAVMTLPPGTRLGRYEIVSALGAGGMGEVYKARDTRLDRGVAIKILPADLAADRLFRERFDREARTISQLTHAHICALYDVGEHASPDTGQTIAYLVMELLEGESLDARLVKGALPLDLALKTAIEVASALDAAHRERIVHRDLKPANIMLTRSGAKLLDFGLAKTSRPAVSTSALAMAPTTPPASITAAGTILGTFQYMAPEQIEGMEADARTDLFAFGCVLFEMLTGKKAFEGKTHASLLGAILKDEPPPISRVQPIAPASLDRIVQTCLAKDPDDRWQTARDLVRELKWVAGPAAGASATGAGHAHTAGDPNATRPSVPWIAGTAIASAAIAAALVWWTTRSAPVSAPIARLQVAPPANVPLLIDFISPDVSISPDGKRIAFLGGTGESRLYVRALDQLDATPIPGAANVRGPFFSPDGEWIGYFQGADLKKVSVRGGASIVVCAGCANGNRGATWGADGTIVFTQGGGATGLRRVAATGGESEPLTTVDSQKGEQSHVWPELLPDGRTVLFTVMTAGAVENAMIAAQDLKTGARKILVRGASQAHYVATGHLTYAVASTLRAAAFDLGRVAIVGDSVPILERLVTKAAGSADFSVSRGGTLAYVSGDAQAAGARLTWVDRAGHEEAIPAPARAYTYVRLSPDGQRVAVDVRDQQNDVWIWDLSRRILTRFTTDPGLDETPVWTPDGSRIVFASNRGGGAANLYWQAANGTGAAERLTTSAHGQVPWCFTPDGRSLFLMDNDPRSGLSLHMISTGGDRAMKLLLRTSSADGHAEISPDGRWLAYQSNGSGRDEIHVRPFPGLEGGHWQVSTEGGTRPVWARSGRELFYIDSQSRLMAVPVQTASSFSAGNPAALGVVVDRGIGGALGRNYDVSPDGKRFLMIRSSAQPGLSPPQLNVVLNWGDELKRLAPGTK